MPNDKPEPAPPKGGQESDPNDGADWKSSLLESVFGPLTASTRLAIDLARSKEVTDGIQKAGQAVLDTHGKMLGTGKGAHQDISTGLYESGNAAVKQVPKAAEGTAQTLIGVGKNLIVPGAGMGNADIVTGTATTAKAISDGAKGAAQAADKAADKLAERVVEGAGNIANGAQKLADGTTQAIKGAAAPLEKAVDRASAASPAVQLYKYLKK